MSNLNVIQGDITKVHADAIVNAANPALRGGGGVDGAIHAAAGPELLMSYEKFMYPHGTQVACPVATPAFNLPAKHIIHVPGPDVRGLTPPPWLADDYHHHEAQWAIADEQLWHAYARSLVLADLLGAGTVTFPSISTGIFGFPLERAAHVAVQAVRAAFISAPRVHTVAIVAFDAETAEAYRVAL